ncbi:hypothetical protein EJB05_24299 [Eragrostis curvula]|uniref:Uncharacterized protein n=1 Tax=Eragrostis curvula TaxID=38414 RepID=A0A5J9V9A1_9POAL|nr:hypothetical protein EJB05_24299 [Eragrostis curvula]
MAYPVKAAIVLFLTALISIQVHSGDAKGTCQLSDIVITQRETGKVVGGKSQFQVTIGNKCSCPQANVKVHCDRINTVEDVDTTKIRQIDSETFIIADGKPITKGSPVIFTYSFGTPQDFPVVSTKPQC